MSDQAKLEGKLEDEDRERLRLEVALAATLERARRAEELLALERSKFQATITELTSQIMDPKGASEQISNMAKLLEQKNTALETLTRQLDQTRKELMALINV